MRRDRVEGYKRRMPHPLVRIVGLSLAGAAVACQSHNPPKDGTVTHNPPAPDPEPVLTPPVGNPPAPLPTWDQVESGHPEGATNPPYPVLVVARDTGGCYKMWMGGMVPPPPDIDAAGGRVLEKASEATGLTQVQCLPGEPQRLLAAWDAAKAGGKGWAPQ